MEKSKNSLFVRIFDYSAKPFASHRELSSLEKLLVSEESKSEVIIGRFRATLTGAALSIVLILFLQSPERDFMGTLFPFLIYFIFSFFLMFKLDIIDSSRIYQEKYFLSWIKYMLIVYDTAFYTWAINSIINNAEFFHSISFISGPWGLTAAFGIFGAIIILTDIFRYDFLSSIYCGIIVLLSRWLLTTWNRNLDFSLTDSSNLALIASLILFTILSCLISENFRKVIMRSKKQESLERYIPDILAKELIDKGEDLKFSGDRSPVTILFSDIRNFTTFSEQVPPEEVIKFLNDYFSSMIDIIFDNNGMLDKIMGDGLMAIFGSPFTSDTNPTEDALNAVNTAIEMKRKLADFNERIKTLGYDPINIGIGINTGHAVLGSIGSEKRKEFTAIGDTVNTASRLESYTKEVNANILISDATRKHLNDRYNIEKIGKIALKGKLEEVQAYKVMV